MSVTFRSNIGQVSVEYRWLFIGRISVEYRTSVSESFLRSCTKVKIIFLRIFHLFLPAYRQIHRSTIELYMLDTTYSQYDQFQVLTYCLKFLKYPQNIRSALVSKVIPVVQGKCSLISAKVSYNISERKSIEDLWLTVCQKRDESDEAMRKIKGMAFFFSSVAVLERKAKEKEPNSGDEENEETECAKTTKSKVYWPAISYWIAMQSPDGLQVSTVPVHSALLNTGMDVTAKSLPDCKRGREEYAVAPLCTTVKDHNNSFLQRKVDHSFEYCLEKLQSQVLDEPVSSVRGCERVVRLQAVCPAFASELQNRAIPALVKAGLQFDVFGLQSASTPENQPVGKVLASSPVVIVLNEVERAMSKLGYALHKGEVFKKNSSAKFTFEHACTVKKFLSVLASNDHLKDRIVAHFSKLESVLADPECEFTSQLKINYDLIEVSEGWCFSSSRREFVQNPIREIGKESPRAFVEYQHTKTPDPKYFREILENSLSPSDTSHFCEYYLRLLNYGIKQHKEKVLCLIGEPNSGKTSLFTPMTRIIPARYSLHSL